MLVGGLVLHQGGQVEERHHVFELCLTNTKIFIIIKKRWIGRL
jgi:hypothetical protein